MQTSTIDVRTRRIHKELGKVTKALAQDVIRPHLDIEVRRPTNPWFLPPPRDRNKDVEAAFETEKVRLGVPNTATLIDVFGGFGGKSAHKPKWKPEEQSEEDRRTADDYLSKLYSWTRCHG